MIFVTAFDRFAVAAFDVAAADYLLKPVDAERLDQTLERARRRLAPEEPPRPPLAPADLERARRRAEP